jgi:hypothetical protein
MLCPSTHEEFRATKVANSSQRYHASEYMDTLGVSSKAQDDQKITSGMEERY